MRRCYCKRGAARTRCVRCSRPNRNAGPISCVSRTPSRPSTRKPAKKSAWSMRCCWQHRGDAVLYFAYGSNMDWAQMNKRCPSARFVGIAALTEHRVGFTRRSVNRGCGVADVIPEAGRKVWGVVYEVSDLDLDRLDKSEGYQPGRHKNS